MLESLIYINQYTDGDTYEADLIYNGIRDQYNIIINFDDTHDVIHIILYDSISSKIHFKK